MLLALTAESVSAPLTRHPTALQVSRYMEPERLTFLCYCDYSGALSKLDTSGCESPGQRAVVGTIIPPELIVTWIGNRYWPERVIEIAKEVANDPLNLTMFSDATYPAYLKAKSFFSTEDTTGQFGACRFNIDADGRAFVPDSRIGEVARTALYLADRYSLHIPEAQKKSFEDIAAASPPGSREKLRNKLAYRWNKSWNTYVSPKPEETYYDRRLQEGLMDNIYQEHIIHNDKSIMRGDYD